MRSTTPLTPAAGNERPLREPAKDEDTFLAVLSEAVATLEREGIPQCLMGGLASAALGRPRWTHDIDIFIRPEDAKRALDALSAVGFGTQETNPNWIVKAIKNGIIVDLIFRAKEEIYLDDEIFSRCPVVEFKGLLLRTLPPEDLLVIKAIIHDEDSPRHWYDALGLLVSQDMDWEYLIRRARHGPRRVLSLLLYAQSIGLAVPDDVVQRLFDSLGAEAS